MTEPYDSVLRQLDALTEGVPYPEANLSNAAALLFTSLPDVSWAGFYRMTEGKLVLGPFQGKPACIVIPVGSGVCGTAVLENRTVVVPDVLAFPGHIACDPDSRSEIVVPLRRQDGSVFGVLDLDSTTGARFTEVDREGLEAFVRLLEKRV